ncbi:MAG TPA: GNAT family N-acetyltransferase [Gaiellaceae bacterium]|nr:GNAT family N-acetyltransferase [Gaiellaceae bacterium]
MVTVREIGEDELEAFIGVVTQAMPREEMGGVAGLIDWRRQAEAMIWLLAEKDGAVAGAGYALTGWHTPPHRGIGAALVLPGLRGSGIGDELRAVLERWAAEHGATELEGPVAEEDDGSIAWAASRGYEEAGRNSRMVLDLTAIDAPAVEPPPGIELVTWAERPELAEGLWEVAREAAPDIPGEEETDVGELEEWLERDMRGSGDRPEAVFIALEDGAVLGYAKLAFSDDTTERAFHDLTGVKRAHRGRGIAALLKATQIAWAKENGFKTLQTSNEVRNAPIRHLNAKHGYVLEPGVVIVRRTIAST